MVREPSPYRLLDLFSGIGGFSLGLERTGGFKTVAFCEIEPACRHLLKHHWPHVPCYDDVTKLTGDRLVADGIAVDALCAGFPCQDLSYAGKGAGLAGQRSGLWFQIARLLRELRDLGRPVRVVALENVSALLGRGLGVVLGDLAALGYDAEWDCIPAFAVGAPHRRDRIWIIAYPRGLEHEGFGDALRRSLAAGLPEAFAIHTGVRLGDDGETDALDPDADRIGSYRAGKHVFGGAELRDEQIGFAGSLGEDVAHAESERARCWGRRSDAQPLHGGQVRLVADAYGERLEGQRPDADPVGRQEPGVGPARLRDGASHRSAIWATEPNVGRVAYGVPARVDRLHGLGNAVVPQVVEAIGAAIVQALAIGSNDGRRATSESEAA